MRHNKQAEPHHIWDKVIDQSESHAVVRAFAKYPQEYPYKTNCRRFENNPAESRSVQSDLILRKKLVNLEKIEALEETYQEKNGEEIKFYQ